MAKINASHLIELHKVTHDQALWDKTLIKLGISADHVHEYLNERDRCRHVCYICQETPVSAFSTTPLIETPNGQFECCEACANEYFPGWETEDEE